MKRIIKGYSFSQKSPTEPCWHRRSKIPTGDLNTFMRDFSLEFSLDLAADRNRRSFYTIKPPNDILNDLLCFETYDFLEYEFDRLLSNAMQSFVRTGKAYFEICTWRDQSNNPKGISFVPFEPLLAFRFSKKTYCVSMLQNRKLKFYCLDNKNILLLCLKDMGYPNNYLIRLGRKFEKNDVLSRINLDELGKGSAYDFSAHLKKCEKTLLRATKNIYWYRITNNSQHMSDSYILYREAKFRTLRKQFLAYMLHQINRALQQHMDVLGFRGHLVAEYSSIDYLKKYDDLVKGKITTEQFSKYIFGF